MPRKTQRRQKTRRQQAQTKRAQKGKRTQKTRRRYKGGNYAKNITIKLVDGTPVTKDALVTFPGGGTMSIPAYQQLMADRDRNGDHIYD